MTQPAASLSEIGRAARLMAALDVLVIDDNRETRKLIATCLRSFGVGMIREAEDGRTGLEAVRVKIPTIILCDWEMSPMNGREFIQTLRRSANGAMGRTKLLMVTGHGSAQVVREAVEAGANAFLVKPLRPDQLWAKLSWVLQDRRPMIESDGRYVFGAQPAA